MTNVLGFRLDAAVEALRRDGLKVELRQVRSRKGVPDGDDSRIVKQTVIDPEHVELLYAVFRTKPEETDA